MCIVALPARAADASCLRAESADSLAADRANGIEAAAALSRWMPGAWGGSGSGGVLGGGATASHARVPLRSVASAWRRKPRRPSPVSEPDVRGTPI